MLELACDEAVFHFNKGHLADPTIPMWVIKAKGKSYYVHHVDCQCPWSTKETPDNPATKGSIKIKNCLVSISDDNVATLTVLTDSDRARVRNGELGIVRIIASIEHIERIKDLIKSMNISHGPIKSVQGTCGSEFYIIDLYRREDFTALYLAMPIGSFRELMPNEPYYAAYDRKGSHIADSGWDPFGDED